MRSAGIDNSTIENSASYIESWLRALKKRKPVSVTSGGAGPKSGGFYFRGNKGTNDRRKLNAAVTYEITSTKKRLPLQPV
jgi:hypothetical protein